jgi:outer membrane protein
MKRLLCGSLFFVWLICFTGLLPVFAGESQIGVIDLAKIMRESEAAKEAKDMLMMDVEAKREVLKEREDEARKMEEELKAKDSVLSDEAKEKKKEAFLESVKELKSLRDGMEEELKKKEARLLGNIGNEVKEIAEKIRKKKNLSIIIERNAVVIQGDAVDITDEVIESYDKEKQ